ncbi:MAG TPA: class I SAM-dependent methyltransferase [Bryobacterales bacterium]|nr:class I SAM-dependent methyltransferase [Bryobacterales bacterium]
MSRRIFVGTVLAALLAAAGFFVAAAPAQQQEPEKLAPYYPTPEMIVQKMLELGELKKGEWHYDLGSGDGRIVIMAAHKFGAHSVGYEIDDELWRKSMGRIKELGLAKMATIVKGDLTKADFSKPDLITVYLLPSSNEKIQPLLEKQMRQGTRVVSHDFDFPAWKADKTLSVEDNDEGDGRTHTLYLYRR